METYEEQYLRHIIEDLRREIDRLKETILKKDCEISRLQEYEKCCHMAYDSYALDSERE